MSLSNPTLTNPAEHFFEWAGGKGILQWYDKENKKNVQVRLPFEFIVLDELNTITGYSKQNESGYWSNEVRNVTKDELFVRTKKGPFEAGLYANLAQTRSKGGKYAKSIYIAHKINDKWVIGNFKASGSAVSAWIEFSKNHHVQNGKITMNRGEKQDAPTGPFYPPTFSFTQWNDDEYKAAWELDEKLQIYLNKYLSKTQDPNAPDEPIEHQLEDTAGSFSDMNDAPDDDGGSVKPAKRADPVIEDIDDEPINLDDIPF